MPRIHSKTKVLSGRAEVISYERDPSTFYYRELVPGTKSYRSRKLQASTVEAAQLEAVDAYSALRVEPPLTPEAAKTPAPFHNSSKGVHKAIQDYLKTLQKQVQAKQISQGTLDVAEAVIYKLVYPFFQQAGITKTSEIKIDTFQQYVVWRQQTAKGRHGILKSGFGVTALTLRKELQQISKWVNHHLLPQKLIKAELASDKRFITYPKIRTEHLLANPAINPADWEIIINYARKEWRGEETRYVRGWWSRTMFWNWMLISKNSGARPEELLKIKWKDVEYEDIGRFSKSKQQERLQEYQQHGIAIEEEDLEELGQVSKEIAHIVLRSSKTGQPRISSCNCVYVFERWLKFQQDWAKQNGYNYEITPNSLVWGCPYKLGDTLSYNRYKQLWVDIRNKVGNQLKGHVFSNDPYTIYSMRSTFVEDNLLAGKDIFLIAKAAGHDVKTLMKHYERIDPRKRSREMTEFEMGKKYKPSTRSAI